MFLQWWKRNCKDLASPRIIWFCWQCTGKSYKNCWQWSSLCSNSREHFSRRWTYKWRVVWRWMLEKMLRLSCVLQKQSAGTKMYDSSMTHTASGVAFKHLVQDFWPTETCCEARFLFKMFVLLTHLILIRQAAWKCLALRRQTAKTQVILNTVTGLICPSVLTHYSQNSRSLFCWTYLAGTSDVSCYKI